MVSRRTAPLASVSEDDPILATTRITGPARSRTRTIRCARRRPRALQCTCDAEALQPPVDVRQRVGGGDVVERDRPLHITTRETELVLIDALEAEAPWLGSQREEPVASGFGAAGLAHEVRHAI